MIAAGCARKLVFSWAGNPGAGSLHAFRRAVEAGHAAARDRGVLALRDGRALQRRRGAISRSGRCATIKGTDIPAANPRIARGDVSVHRRAARGRARAQSRRDDRARAARRRRRATRRSGGCSACRRRRRSRRAVIVVVEELVDTASCARIRIARSFPGMIVDAVVVEPWGRASVVRAGALRPRQRLLRGVGGHLARSGERSQRISTSM